MNVQQFLGNKSIVNFGMEVYEIQTAKNVEEAVIVKITWYCSQTEVHGIGLK